jgi:Uma2 family endonuclease
MSTGHKKNPEAAVKPAKSAKSPARAGHKAASRKVSEAGRPALKHQDGTAPKHVANKATRKSATAAGKRTGAKLTKAVAKPSAATPARSRPAAGKSATPRSEPSSRATRRHQESSTPTHGRDVASNGHAGGHEVQHAAVPAVPQASTKRPRNEREEQISHALFQALDGFVEAHELGRVMAQARFDWGEIEEPGLEPDMAFVSYERWADYRHVPTSLTWHVVPDLVVEVIRDSEQTTPVIRWLEAYFQAGVRRVWVVYPDRLKIHDHESVSSARVIDSNQSIDGGDLLPGFQLPLKDLLAESKA